MIKINLATRKAAVTATADGGKTSGTGFKNFLNAGLKIDARLDGFKELPIRKLAVAALACYAASWMLDSYKEDELNKVAAIIAKARDDQTKLKTELAKTRGYEQIKKDLDNDEKTLRTKIETIQKLLAGRQTPPKMMIALSGAIPQDVWLTGLKIGEQDVSFKGASLGFNQISDFMKNLNESAYFTDVRLQGSQKSKDESGAEVAGFELEAKRR
jgi:hypothetical protein